MNQMSKMFNPIVKFTNLSLTMFPFKEPLCPISIPKDKPLLNLNTGNVAPKVNPKELTVFPSSL